jgi:hypothetical protein
MEMVRVTSEPGLRKRWRDSATSSARRSPWLSSRRQSDPTTSLRKTATASAWSLGSSASMVIFLSAGPFRRVTRDARVGLDAGAITNGGIGAGGRRRAPPSSPPTAALTVRARPR